VRLWALLTAGCLLLATSVDVSAQARGGRESSGSERKGNSETSREGRERAERGSRAGGSEAGRREGRDNDRSAQNLARGPQHDATRSGGAHAEAKHRASEARASEAKSFEAEPSEAKPSEAKPSEAKPSEAKPSEAKPSEARPEPNRARSDHAVQRGKEGRRTGPAFGDAQRARQSDVYKQPDGRYVVRGRNGREHIFEPDGTHVTSIDRPKAAHEGKVDRGERRPVTEQEFEEFQKIFQ
jgi:hypothetical protein